MFRVAYFPWVFCSQFTVADKQCVITSITREALKRLDKCSGLE